MIDDIRYFNGKRVYSKDFLLERCDKTENGSLNDLKSFSFYDVRFKFANTIIPWSNVNFGVCVGVDHVFTYSVLGSLYSSFMVDFKEITD